MRLLLASGNRKKLIELQRVAAPLGVEVVQPADIGGLPECVEDGDTFAANAAKKARDFVFLDVAELVGYTDIFVLCTARNARQVRAIADAVRGMMKAEHQLLYDIQLILMILIFWIRKNLMRR